MTQSRIPGRVSIGIPTRNRANYVMRALRSVLAQTYRDVEVVVSDNASTDGTVQRLEEIVDPRIVFLKQENNIGMVANFNTCLTAATGEFVLMLSDDDLLEKDAVEKLCRPFLVPCHGLQPESVGLTWCPCIILDHAGKALWSTEAGPLSERTVSLITNQFNGMRGPRFCSIMLRTADALEVGGYNEARYGALCDMGNWTRVAARYDYTICIPEPAASYTIHAVSETSQSRCQDWQQWGENVLEDLVEALPPVHRASGEKALRAAGRNFIANVTATILIQTVGQPGWLSPLLREVFRSRRYFFTLFTLRRILRDGWKIRQLKGKNAKR